MRDNFFIVELFVNVESVPQVAADDNAAKSELLGQMNIVDAERDEEEVALRFSEEHFQLHRI